MEERLKGDVSLERMPSHNELYVIPNPRWTNFLSENLIASLIRRYLLSQVTDGLWKMSNEGRSSGCKKEE